MLTTLDILARRYHTLPSVLVEAAPWAMSIDLLCLQAGVASDMERAKDLKAIAAVVVGGV